MSRSKGEGISHGTLYSFPQPLPQSTPQLSMKQCHFFSHGNTQDNSQVQELLPCSWLPWELTRELLSHWERLPAEQDLSWQSLYGFTQATKSDTVNWVPCVLWQQVEADESYPSVRSSILVRELGFLPCPNQGPKCCQLPNHATKKRKGLFSACCY